MEARQSPAAAWCSAPGSLLGPRAEKRPRFDPTSGAWCHRLKLLLSILPFEKGGTARDEPGDHFLRPRLSAEDRFKDLDDEPHVPGPSFRSSPRAARVTWLSQSVRSVRVRSSLRIVAPNLAPPRVGARLRFASSRRVLRWSAASAGVPGEGTCERRSRRIPCEDRDAPG